MMEGQFLFVQDVMLTGRKESMAENGDTNDYR